MIRIQEIHEEERFEDCDFFCDTKALYYIHGIEAYDKYGDEQSYKLACHPHLCILSTTIEGFVNELDI